MRLRAAILVAVTLAACTSARPWRPPFTDPATQAVLERFAPIVVQETAPGGVAARWDHPAAIDPDGSGTLADDYGHPSVSTPVPFYTAASDDAERLYLFYGLYYVADWSGRGTAPEIDHRGDFEGALVVVSRARQAVEAVITQAHKRFYLWRPEEGLTLEGDRPLLFSESGGHGLYAFLDRPWHAKGGGRYPRGMRSLPPASLRRLATVLRPLSDVEPFVEPGRTRFKGLDRGATPPWFWRGGGARTGAIVRDPATLYASLRSSRSKLK